jgi:5-hydroxyisourate hydrolase-like protein (transthyretin family)
MRVVAAFSIAVLIALPSAAAEVVRGKLCVTGTPCAESLCSQSIDPNPEPRTFTFTRSGTNRYDFGVLDAGATRISCDEKGSIELLLEVPALPRGGIVRLAISTPDAQKSWTLQFSERQPESRIHLSGPPGKFDIRLQSDGYVAWQKTIDLATTTTLITAKLQPFPALTGRVVDRATGTPVAGALITTNGRSGRAIATASGQFALALDPNEWPKTLRISAGGYAEMLLPAPAARSAAALGDVAVSRGGTIAVQLRQPKPGTVVALELHRVVDEGRRLGPLVRTLRLDKGSELQTPKFDNVERGDYLVVAVGLEEWEKLGEPVTVVPAEESRLPISVVPFRLRVETRLKGEPIPKAHVALRNRDMFWTAGIKTDEAGVAVVTLWQGGRFNATVDSPGTPYLERRVIERNEDTEWVIEIPAREVTGIVIDGATGKPVRNAGVSLDMHSPEGFQLSVSTKADADGRFRFAPVAYGEHTLKAAARGYPVTEMTYSFPESEARQSVTVKLEAAPPIRLLVNDSRGNPIIGARVLQFTGLTRRNMGVTDSDGSVEVLIPPGEMRDIFVVPRDGSLAFTHLAPTVRETTITVPDAVSRLVLRAVEEDDVPIPNVAVVMRYNGAVLPYEVMVALTTRQGTKAASNDQGQIVLDHMPAGVYEFWPVGSTEELLELAAGVGPSAPVKIAAAPGENVAVMTFEPVAKP